MWRKNEERSRAHYSTWLVHVTHTIVIELSIIQQKEYNVKSKNIQERQGTLVREKNEKVGWQVINARLNQAEVIYNKGCRQVCLGRHSIGVVYRSNAITIIT